MIRPKLLRKLSDRIHATSSYHIIYYGGNVSLTAVSSCCVDCWFAAVALLVVVEVVNYAQTAVCCSLRLQSNPRETRTNSLGEKRIKKIGLREIPLACTTLGARSPSLACVRPTTSEQTSSDAL